MLFTVFPLAITIAVSQFLAVAGLQSLESDLYKKVFDQNTSFVERLPIKHGSKMAPLQVRHRMWITNFYGVKLDDQVIEIDVLLSLRWKSQFMWNISEYGIKYLSVNPERIWQPGLIIQESNKPALLRAFKTDGNVVLFHDGTTTIDFSRKIRISCKMSSCFFPEDIHICNITLAIISHNASEAVFMADDTSYATASPNPTHDLWSIKIGQPSPLMGNMLFYPGNWKTSMMRRSMEMKRKPSYYIINIVTPIILIYVIELFAVILPKESGEKISLLITCFLTQIVYLDVLIKIFPKTSNYIPLMIGFTTSLLVLTALQISLICSASFFAAEAASEKRSLLKQLCTCWFGLKRRKREIEPVRSSKDNDDRQYHDNQEISEIETEEIEDGGGVEKNESKSRNGDHVKEENTSEDRKYREWCICLSNMLERISVALVFFSFAISPAFLHMMYEKKISGFC